MSKLNVKTHCWMMVDGKRKQVLWSEFCKVYGHHFRSDKTCVCGEKGSDG